MNCAPTVHPSQGLVCPPAQGVTLIELLICLVIAGLLAATAAPTMSRLLDDVRLTGSTNQLLSLLHAARAEGAYRSAMLVCSGRGKCQEFRKPDNQLILVADRNDSQSLDSSDEIVTTMTLPDGMTVQWRSFRNKPWLRINRYGVAYYQNGHFLFCYHGQARKVILNYQARARISDEGPNKHCPGYEPKSS